MRARASPDHGGHDRPAPVAMDRLASHVLLSQTHPMTFFSGICSKPGNHDNYQRQCDNNNDHYDHHHDYHHEPNARSGMGS